MILFKILAATCFMAFVSTSPMITTLEPTTTTTLKPTTTTLAPSSVCKICKEMVAEARDTLVSNLTVDELKQVFEGSCRILIPIKSVAKLCVKYADELVPELVDTLAQEMNPDRVCVSSGLCTADSLAKILLSVKEVAEGLTLRVAEVLAKHDTTALTTIVEATNFSDEKIQNLLKGICYLSPGRIHSGECADAVNLYYNVVKTVLFTTVKTNSNCMLCEMVLQYADNEMSSSNIVQDISNLVLPICDYTKSYKDECKAFIRQYLPRLWNLILSELKAKTLCTDIGLCTSIEAAKIVASKPKPVKSEECDICKEVLGEVKTELLSEEVMSAAKEAMIELCDLCAAPKQCTAYINSNFAKFYKGIVAMVDPTITCAAIGACPKTKKLVHVSAKDPNVISFGKLANKVKEPVLHRIALQKEMALPRLSENVLECTACKYLVHYIQEEIVTNKSISNFESFMRKVCQKLPEVSSECDTFVDKYASALAALLAQEVDPSYVCYKLINVCSTQVKHNKNIFPKTQIKSIKWNECSVCTLAVDYMGELLEKDQIDTDLTKIVEQVCQMLPKSAYDQCVSIISTYGPSIMHLIGELANSKEVCKRINVCKHQALLGKKKCTYGPAYWCRDVATAHQCNAYEHCSRHVWNKFHA